ncbi:MAG: hypothetical protein K9K40_05475 [Desulfotignum sp.]|nr:hypothetical protein [Desulfotignum sp.]
MLRGKFYHDPGNRFGFADGISETGSLVAILDYGVILALFELIKNSEPLTSGDFIMQHTLSQS